MTSCLLRIERARPLLGTTVAIRVEGLEESDIHRAIDDAFGEIALVHRLMSFHEETSDISRLNREACGNDVEIHPYTFEVLQEARALSEISQGCFNITVASELVEWGMLPAPRSSRLPDRRASWRDVALGRNRSVRYLRPLWIDLGGIAKGYAVDKATEKLKSRGAVQSCVNAGGDLRIHGPKPERVRLALPEAIDAVPVLDIENAAVASSSGHAGRRLYEGTVKGPHLHGASREAISVARFVSVAADRCIIADALTKVVLADEGACDPVLRHYGASAHLYDPRQGWRHFGA